jgi:hypothetical protein
VVTELRVHGVTGMPAERMLDRPLLHQVAGDSGAGFFRPRPEYDATTGPGGAELEAYRWGNLTSGAASRALWLLLLPLMLANGAMWLRPPAGSSGAFLTRTLCRIFAGALTATFVLAAVGVAVDLVGWQCAGPDTTCAARRPWLAFLSSGFFSPPGRRMAVTALAPAAAIGLLWYLGALTWSRYEGFLAPFEAGGDVLQARGFWRTAQLTSRLRNLHLAVAFATLCVPLLAVLAPHDHRAAGWVLGAAAVLVLAACLVALCLPGMVQRDQVPGWAPALAHWLRSVALLLTAATLGYAMLPRPAWTSSGGLPGYSTGIAVVFAAQVVLLMVLAVVVLVQRAPGQYLLGLGAPVLASLGLLVAAAFSAGVMFLVADILNASAEPALTRPPAPLIPPPALYWASVDVVIGTVSVASAALVGWLWILPRLRAEAAATTDADFPGQRASDPARASAIDLAIALARLTDHSGPLLAWWYTPLAVASTVFAGLALAGVTPVELAPAGTPAERVLGAVTYTGTVLIGIGTILLMILGAVAYRYQWVRRIVGVAWDIGTFWPRTSHPLAPPCYAARAVPELVTRATWLAGPEGGGGVILSGHSQGSVLLAAAVLQLPHPALPGIALLTYGSPLRRLYARFFPAYVDQAMLDAVADRIGDRWVNLWRDTDPIGAVTAPPGEDRRFVDPLAFGIPRGDTVYPPIHGHISYESDPAYGQAVSDLTARVTSG